LIVSNQHKIDVYQKLIDDHIQEARAIVSDDPKMNEAKRLLEQWYVIESQLNVLSKLIGKPRLSKQATAMTTNNDSQLDKSNANLKKMLPLSQICDTGPLDIYRERTGAKTPRFDFSASYDCPERSPQDISRCEKLDKQRVAVVTESALRSIDNMERMRQGKPHFLDLGALRLEKSKETEKPISAIADGANNRLDLYSQRMSKLQKR
jgi:hypothetical protein